MHFIQDQSSFYSLNKNTLEFLGEFLEKIKIFEKFNFTYKCNKNTLSIESIDKNKTVILFAITKNSNSFFEKEMPNEDLNFSINNLERLNAIMKHPRFNFKNDNFKVFLSFRDENNSIFCNNLILVNTETSVVASHPLVYYLQVIDSDFMNKINTIKEVFKITLNSDDIQNFISLASLEKKNSNVFSPILEENGKIFILFGNTVVNKSDTISSSSIESFIGNSNKEGQHIKFLLKNTKTPISPDIVTKINKAKMYWNAEHMINIMKAFQWVEDRLKKINNNNDNDSDTNTSEFSMTITTKGIIMVTMTIPMIDNENYMIYNLILRGNM